MNLNPITADKARMLNELQAIAKILKIRFPNLTVEETIRIAGEIIIAIEETIDL